MGFQQNRRDFTHIGEKTALMLDPKDNVASVLNDLKKEEICLVVDFVGNERNITALEDVPFGHKIALQDVSAEQELVKYGEEIGKAKNNIKKGEWVHTHNMYCNRGVR